MKRILLTGANGFLGTHFKTKFQHLYKITNYQRSSNFEIDFNEFDVILHFAAKAQAKKASNEKDLYYKSNVEFTKILFDKFLTSTAEIFVFMSSIKACADASEELLTEKHDCNPQTEYGKSKLQAEQYLLSQTLPRNKKLFILRPTIIHGSGNKGNLFLLYKLISTGLPWPFHAFNNKRSYCSVGTVLFIVNELINREDIPNGIYNITDDGYFSTNEIIKIISSVKSRKPLLLNIPPRMISVLAKIGDKLKLPFNSDLLEKLTGSLIVDNTKIKNVIAKEFPLNSNLALINSFESFNKND